MKYYKIVNSVLVRKVMLQYKITDKQVFVETGLMK